MDIPLTRVQGLTDNSGGYLWFYDINHLTGTQGSGVISGVNAIVKGLSSGSYNVEIWNTYPPGGILEDTLISTSGDSIFFPVPDFAYDIAAKIFRDGSGTGENRKEKDTSINRSGKSSYPANRLTFLNIVF